ncbi:hypothetical protein FCL40_00520 [Ferrimonas sediminicola]|uniref:OmpR/PhoB-type domain-containing protein n=1 Tax=Ferrimonas sediminicola TaxID=2569538 RepID=A0A4U1BIC6_9GAMM|nr:winged helix-turn-helix domain-containing protein [Ferrimonas sediminicola]TKB51073.1 hypothetical protein FCL40_00520 [Ferrimonas sediminicola]
MAQTHWIVGDFLYLSRERRLRSPDGRWRRLNPKAARVLEVFLTHPGQRLTYTALLELAWDGRIVSDGAIRRVVADLRKAFRDDPRAPQYLQTLQGLGYCWLVAPEAASVVAVKPPGEMGWLLGVAGLVVVALLLMAQQHFGAREGLNRREHRTWPRFSETAQVGWPREVCQPMAGAAQPPLRY